MTKRLGDILKAEMRRMESPLNHPSLYVNREQSWMDFNRRVLHQAIRKDVPLLERLKFLAITSSNLDEFIEVRLSSIMNKMIDPTAKPDIAGLLPRDEYHVLFPEVLAFKRLQEKVYQKLVKKVEREGFQFGDIDTLDNEALTQLKRLFMQQIFPLLTPVAVDSTKELPLLRSKQLAIAVSLEDRHNPNLNVLTIVPISSGLQRLYSITVNKQTVWFRVEDIIKQFLHSLFINKIVKRVVTFRLLREADIELDPNQDIYIIDRMRQTLQQREHGRPIFMDYTGDKDKGFIRMIQSLFDITPKHIYRFEKVIDYSFLMSGQLKRADLEYVPFESQYPAEIIGEHDMFTAISNNELLFHHPYESFGPIINFLEHAADDPNVLTIRQTLYRVSSKDSPIVEALCRAAKQGKDVTVLLEIKARFDEARNIGLVEKLQAAGATIVYGVEKLKTHCKFILVARREGKAIRLYSHIGTGNYNDKTAKIYTDLSYFSANAKLGEDLITIFNILTGFSEPNESINKLFYSPYNIRTRLYKLIDREIEAARAGKPAFIAFKLNSLSDKGIIRRLYEAAEAGVRISIVVRGICSMKPIHRNITIRSIIGRFLEHSRIYYFHNGGNGDIYMSSADLLTRNLDRRIEIMVRLTEEVRGKLMSILQQYFADTHNTYLMDTSGQFELLQTDTEAAVNIHDVFMQQALDNHRFRNIRKIPLKQRK